MQDPAVANETSALLSEVLKYFIRPEAVSGVLASIFGFFAAQAWTKWRTRLAEIRWTTKFTPIGESIAHTDFGIVKILWNDTEFHNVVVADIEFENQSRHDLQSVELELIRFGGHLLKGRYDVHNGSNDEPAATPALY